MRRKIPLIFLCLTILCVIIIIAIFVKVSRHAGQTIMWLQNERGPQRIPVGEIPLVRKKGWELFANSGEVRDIGFYGSQYYLATAGGIVICEESGKVARTLNTTWGLPENSYRQLLVSQNGMYALSEGGILIQIKEDNALVYDLSPAGKVFSISGEEAMLYIGGDKGVFLIRENRMSPEESIERVNVVMPFLNGFAAGTTNGTVYISTSVRKDSVPGLDGVNDLLEHEGMLYVATPLGLVTLNEQGSQSALEGEFLTTIEEMDGAILCGTFDGRIITGNRFKRVTSKKGRINRLRTVNDRLFACTDEGVFVLDGETWQIFYKPRVDTPLEYITALLSMGGELLIGTFEDGCFSLKGEYIFRVPLGDGVNEINHLALEDRSVFFATNSGLFEMNPDGVRRHEGLPSLFVNSIITQGKSLIAGTSRGFCVMNRVDLSVKNYGSFNGLINNRVYAVAAADENIVLGTLGGISIFDGIQFRNVTSANSPMTSNWINGLQSAQDRVYVGTYGGGIGYFDKKGIHIIEETDGAEVNMNGLFYRKPLLFAGTCNKGLFVYNEKNGRTDFLKGVFPLDNVTAVSADDQYYYIGTTQGIYRIDAKELSLL